MGTKELKNKYEYLVRKSKEELSDYFLGYFDKKHFLVDAGYNVEKLADLCLSAMTSKCLSKYNIKRVYNQVYTSLRNAEYLLLLESMQGTIEVITTGVEISSFIVSLEYKERTKVPELDYFAKLHDFLESIPTELNGTVSKDAGIYYASVINYLVTDSKVTLFDKAENLDEILGYLFIVNAPVAVTSTGDYVEVSLIID